MIDEAISLIEKTNNVSVSSYECLSTGATQSCYKLNIGSAFWFMKLNTSSSHPEIINAEVEAIECFIYNGIKVPKLIFYDYQKQFSLLVTEHINATESWTSQSIHAFADNLVKLHSIAHDKYGWGINNYIGSLIQNNGWYDDFSEYYWESRLLPQLELAVYTRLLDDIDHFYFIKQILSQFPKSKACLIHGDLWSGNHLEDNDGNSYLIDASIQYGCREMDLAMMLLFGGFPKEVFEIYLIKFPLDKSWRERIDVFQLYYLLVHLNIFGLSYLDQAKRCVSRIKENFHN